MTGRGRLLVTLLLVVGLPAVAAGQAPLAPAPPSSSATLPSGAATRDDLERRQATIAKPTLEWFSIHGALLGTAQWIANSDAGRGSVFGAGSLDLNVIARPSNSVRFFLDVEGLAGPGPDQKLGTLSRLHNDADRLEGAETKWIVRRLFLRLSWLDERVRFSIGKLDLGDYFDRNFFAEDETTQFLDAALLSSPMLRAPPNGPGTAVRVSVADWRFAFGVSAPDDVGGDLSGLPYMIGELGHRNIFALRGHYRLWARVGSVPEDRDRVTWGAGVSIDQLVTSTLGVFLRAGLSRSQGEDLTSHAWSAGFQLTPAWLGRGKDAYGIGYSDQREPGGRERMVETYYRLALADWLFLIANVQWIVSGPNQVSGGVNRNVVVPGLRALVLF